MERKQAGAVTVLAALLVVGIAQLTGARSVLTMGISSLMGLSVLALLVNWLAFVPSFFGQTEKFYDLTGSITFLLLISAATYLGWSQGTLSARGLLLVGLVAIWTIRLGSFLFGRVHEVGKDARFDEIKLDAMRFLMAWTLQATWAFISSLPVLIVVTLEGEQTSLGVLDYIGVAIWLLGFGIEVIADRQKTQFRRRHPNGEHWIDEGLWSYAQHPNYFGEICLWVGIFIIAAATLSGSEWCAAASPVFVAFTLLQMSGVPMIQARNRAKWGSDPRYQEYLARTRLLLPLKKAV